MPHRFYPSHSGAQKQSPAPEQQLPPSCLQKSETGVQRSLRSSRDCQRPEDSHHPQPCAGLGQLGCRPGARPIPGLLRLIIPAFVCLVARPGWLHTGQRAWKPDQLEHNQVFFQAGPRALGRPVRTREREVAIHPLRIHSFPGQITFIACPPSGRPCLGRCGVGTAGALGRASYKRCPRAQDAHAARASKARVLPSTLRPVHPGPGGDDRPLRVPPTRYCWSLGLRTSPSSRQRPARRAQSAQSARLARSR